MGVEIIDLKYIDEQINKLKEQEIKLQQQLQEGQQQMQMLQMNLHGTQGARAVCEKMKNDLTKNDPIKLAELPK
jgi:prefoldin subunit 5